MKKRRQPGRRRPLTDSDRAQKGEAARAAAPRGAVDGVGEPRRAANSADREPMVKRREKRKKKAEEERRKKWRRRGRTKTISYPMKGDTEIRPPKTPTLDNRSRRGERVNFFQRLMRFIQEGGCMF